MREIDYIPHIHIPGFSHVIMVFPSLVGASENSYLIRYLGVAYRNASAFMEEI